MLYIEKSRGPRKQERERLGGQVSIRSGDDKYAIGGTSRLWEGLEIKDRRATVKNCQKCNVAF